MQSGLRSSLWILLLLCSATFASLFSSFQTRALWVTRWDYRSTADLQQIFANAAAGHFNTILFQVRGNGTVAYRSDLEPRAAELSGQPADWDPLQEAIELAHQHGLQLHAWINLYPGWMGDDPPRQRSQLYHTHPEWFMVDAAGRRQLANDHYTFLSPTHPAVTPYLLSVCRELVDRYPVDGLHLDYIRFPGPAFSYDSPSVGRFRIQHGVGPEQNQAAWSAFRRQAISDFLHQLRKTLRLNHPQMILTASVLGDYDEGYRVYLQDSHEWLAADLVDAIFPMIYTPDNLRFSRLLADHRLNDHRRHVFAGVYIKNADRLQRQLQIAQELGCQGVSLFSYELLYPNHVMLDRFREILQDQWPAESQPAPMAWKTQSRDTQGPQVHEAYTLPVQVYSNAKFKIAARISDPSGVYDDKTGSNGQGIYLLYDRVWPPDKGQEVRLSPLKNRSGWYITDEALRSENAGLDFRFRIFAWDDFHESAGHAKRNLGFSDIWSLCILSPAETYQSNGAFGPEVWDPLAIAMDQRHHLWVVTQAGKQIEIVKPGGAPAAFSPIRTGLNVDFNQQPLEPISGLTFCPPNVMCVSSGSSQRIYRYDAATGAPLPSIELSFQPSGLACDKMGHIFVLENGSSRWHVLSYLGIEMLGSPLGIEHTAEDIAVLDDGSRVFISDRSTGGVQCWQGAIEGYRVRYWQEVDLPAVDVGWARIASDRSDYVYVPHSQRGAITIFNRSGKPVEYLLGGKPGLNAPRDIAVSTTGDSLYVIESTGSGPTHILQWIKKVR